MSVATLQKKENDKAGRADTVNSPSSQTGIAMESGAAAGVPLFLRSGPAWSAAPGSPTPPSSAANHASMPMQRQVDVGIKAHGNQLNPPLNIQTKFTVAAADTPLEREADVAARHITSGQKAGRISRLAVGALAQSLQREEAGTKQPASDAAGVEQGSIQPKCAVCEEDAEKKEASVQREPVEKTTPKLNTARAANEMERSGVGSPLDPLMRSEMEAGFDADFSGVRLHTGGHADEAAGAINARAFTRGADVYLARNESKNDRHLMAHELTHVVQQTAPRLSSTAQPALLSLQRGILALSPSGLPVQRINETPEVPTLEFFNYEGVNSARVSFDRRFLQIMAYSMGSQRAGDAVRLKLLAFSGQYGNAYQRYEQVIRAARAEAQNQERWIAICVGIGTGVLMNVGAAFILPSSAAGWFALTAEELATAAASGLGQAVVGAPVSAGIMELLSVPGTNLEPGGLDPNVLELRIWRRVSDLYRSGLTVAPAAVNLHFLSTASEYLLGEIRVHVAGGETHMTEDEVLDLMVDLVRGDTSMARRDAQLTNSLTSLGELQAAAEGLSLSDYSVEQMESDIWVLWMSGLTDPSVLDLDAIEDHLLDIGVLGPSSRLGVDFGRYTTEDDEREARDAARGDAGLIRSRLRRLEGAGLGEE